MPTYDVPVLIVGAGPTGLVLAIWLHRLGVPFRIIERHAGPGEQSRALVVHARTLEFYRQVGLHDRIVAAGTPIETVRLRESGNEIGSFSLRDMGQSLSPFPFALGLPQDEHERLLGDELRALGVRIEWETELERLQQTQDGVECTLSYRGRQEQTATAYVVGCDGASSRVRAALGVAFSGGTYERLYYVADVKPRSRRGDGFVIAIDRADFALRMPARRGENERLIGYVPPQTENNPSFEDVRPVAERLMGIEVAEVNWFSTYRTHHRMAERFRVGRCFLLGDAAHVHSPVGGQGMNTGIGDAVNLSWKLAQSLRSPALGELLLGSYEAERMAFARTLIATTDRVFQVVTTERRGGGAFVRRALPRVLPAVASVPFGRSTIFRILSQIRIEYHQSALSDGRAGRVRGGDRLPWVGDQDNFAPLRSLAWQVHVYGEPSSTLTAFCEGRGLPLHRFAWSRDARRCGISRDAALLIRPDGYIASAAEVNEATERISRSWNRFQARPSSA